MNILIRPLIPTTLLSIVFHSAWHLIILKCLTGSHYVMNKISAISRLIERDINEHAYIWRKQYLHPLQQEQREALSP